MERALSAPGKLFLSGEYAVLWGGTARIAAVSPRAHAYVRRREDAQVHLVLEEGRLRGKVTPLGVHWEHAVPQGFRFMASAVDELVQCHAQQTLGFTLCMAPTPPQPNGEKLGLGSSARATLLAAEAARYVLEERVDPLKVALVAHALTQGLRGSGGDVAASFAGGVIRYRRFQVEAILTPARPRAAAYADSAPVDLVRVGAPQWSAVYAHAGQAASTTALISTAELKLKERDREDFVASSDAVGREFEEALGAQDFEALRETTLGLRELLLKVGPLETEGVRRILALGAAYGCAGKASGAGGGDGCLLFCPAPEVARELLSAYRGRGVHAFAVQFEPGLRGETRADERLKAWSTVT